MLPSASNAQESRERAKKNIVISLKEQQTALVLRRMGTSFMPMKDWHNFVVTLL